MKILNLTSLEKSDIKYKITQFPDGQQNCKIDPNYFLDCTLGPVQISSRLNNFLDLEIIICTVMSLRNLGAKRIHLFTPWFIGSRSDRQFEEGGNNYLKDVICPVINSLNFDSVTVLDPHSYCLEMGLKNFKKVSNAALVKDTLADISSKLKDVSFRAYGHECIFIAPDAGASHKIYKTLDECGIDTKVITCSKERDTEGKLTKTFVPIDTFKTFNKDFIIIDDICDGGRTFINIAKRIKELIAINHTFTGNIYLIVTHGIFSAGFEELTKYFDGIYTTNSITQWQDIGKSEPYHQYKDLLKTLNVF